MLLTRPTYCYYTITTRNCYCTNTILLYHPRPLAHSEPAWPLRIRATTSPHDGVSSHSHATYIYLTPLHSHHPLYPSHPPPPPHPPPAASQPGLSESERRCLLTLVVVGGGPTGVEYCGEIYPLVESGGQTTRILLDYY